MVTDPIASLTLVPLDVGVVALFLLGVFALGFSVRLRENSVLQYLAAGRRLTLPLFVATLVSTWYGGILGVSESVRYYGLGAWLLIGVPFYVFGAIYAVFLAGRVRDEDQISIPERLHARYGKPAGLLGAFLIFLLSLPAAHVLMLGVLVQCLTGWRIEASVIVATLAGTLFLYRGGLLADARVSLLAFVGMYAGFAAMLVYCLTHYPLIATWQGLENKQLLTWTGGQGPIQIVSFFILGAWTLVDPAFHQRAASAMTPQVARKGIWVCVGFWFLFDTLSISTAMYAIAILPPLGSGATSLDALAIYPNFAENVLPAGLKALFLCGMLGTVLSAMVGYTLVSGATMGREIYARWRGEGGDARINLWTRFGLAVACVLAVWVGLSVESVVALWYSWGGAVVGALLLPVCHSYGLFPKWRVASGAMVASIALSGAVALGLVAYGIRTADPYVTVHIGEAGGGTDISVGTLAPGLAVSALVLGLSAVLAIIRGNHHGGERNTE